MDLLPALFQPDRLVRGRGVPPKRRSSLNSALEQALEFQRLLDEGVVNTKAEIARLHGLSRARVTQVLSIFRLPESVLDALLDSCREDGPHCTERQLRPILRLPESAQLAALRQLQERNSDLPTVRKSGGT